MYMHDKFLEFVRTLHQLIFVNHIFDSG